MQKFAIFVKKSLKINKLYKKKKKNIVKLEIIVIIQVNVKVMHM